MRGGAAGSATNESGVSPVGDGSKDRPLRVVSLNVARLSKRETKRSYEIGAMLRALTADVCALQEICSESPEDGALAQVAKGARLAHSTFEAHAPLAARGIALLHRHPAVAHSGGRLPARAGDDKGFARSVLEVPRADVTSSASNAGVTLIEVIGVHLDPFSQRARSRQIDALAKVVGPATMPRIVVGDLNAMSLRALLSRRAHDETVAMVANALGVDVSPLPLTKSFPSRLPLFAIDWVLVSSALEVRSVESIKSRLSDHAALLAEVAFHPDAGKTAPSPGV